jgi:transposase-like protein
MTQDQEQFYVKNRGLKCPYCKTSSVEAGELEEGDCEMYQNAKCLKCKREWTDQYTLTGAFESEVEVSQ